MKDMRNPYMPGRGIPAAVRESGRSRQAVKILPAEGQEKTVRVLTEWEEK